MSPTDATDIMTASPTQSLPLADMIPTTETVAAEPPTDPWATCPIRFGTQTSIASLGVAGLGLNYVALVVLWKDQDLRRPFRAIQASLTIADLCFSLISLLASSVDLATTLTAEQSRSTFCSMLSGLYHGLMGCHATNTLLQSFDRALAVVAPLEYRSCIRWQRLSFDMFGSIAVLPAWIIAVLEVVAVPILWYLYGDRRSVEESGSCCLPFIAAVDEFLVVQAVLLLVSVVGVAASHMGTIFKLSRTAVLVVPFFGTRTADNTASERLQNRRSTLHALSQAFSFSFIYLAVGIYLLWLGVGNVAGRRTAEVCSGHFILSVLPSVNSVINPLLTLWRVPNWIGYCHALRRSCCCVSSHRVHPRQEYGDGPSRQTSQPPHSGKKDAKEISRDQPQATTSATRDLTSSAAEDEAVLRASNSQQHEPTGIRPGEIEAQIGQSPKSEDGSAHASDSRKHEARDVTSDEEEIRINQCPDKVEPRTNPGEAMPDLKEVALAEQDEDDEEDEVLMEQRENYGRVYSCHVDRRSPTVPLAPRRTSKADSETNSKTSTNTCNSYNPEIDDCRANAELLHLKQRVSVIQH